MSGVMRIPLTQDKVALIDVCDATRVTPYRWCAVDLHGKWYAMRREHQGGPSLYMHRVILPPGEGLSVDHVNGDGLDNRRCNLREATRSEQSQNAAPRRGKLYSAFKGVTWRRNARLRAGGSWVAQIRIPEGRMIAVYASSEVDAARAYNALADQHFGEFARLNVLPEGVA